MVGGILAGNADILAFAEERSNVLFPVGVIKRIAKPAAGGRGVIINKCIVDLSQNRDTFAFFNFVEVDGQVMRIGIGIAFLLVIKLPDRVGKVVIAHILIGEVWETAQHWLNGDIFDSTMNYDFRKHCRRFFAEQSIDAAEFDARVTNMRMRYKLPVLYAQLNLLDSHDVSRFYSLCEKDPARMQLAVLFQMTFTGIPSVFYGDERGIYGLQEAEYRHEMTWSQEPPALAEFYKKAMHLRTEHPALCRGSYHTVKAEKKNGLYGYERTDEKEKITVFLNNQSAAADIPSMNGKMLWQQGYEEKNNSLAPMGFAVFTQEV